MQKNKYDKYATKNPKEINSVAEFHSRGTVACSNFTLS